MTLKDAKEYISFCIKEGIADEEEFVGMSNKKLIKWAEYNVRRGDYYSNQKEER
jgi:hypothetical protein